ncbi:MAG: pilus assembly protein [Candidatus Dormibacteraeota bacterium]|nr:pilus assembly protein [Candidatus Dormibacteraeota bacterium]
MVEFALVAPIFMAAVIGLFSAVMFVLEVQVANQSAQAAARWGVAAVNFSGAGPSPQCPGGSPPSGMVSAAKAAAGPFATSLSVTDGGGTATGGGAVGSAFCQITVSIPTLGFGGYFGIGPKYVTATAIDYVT